MGYERIGRMWRRKLQEEAKGRRINEDFIADSYAARNFREHALALDDGNFPIEGKSPAIFMEEQRSNVSLREMAAETIINRSNGEPVGMSFLHEFFGPDEFCRERFGRLCRMREAGEISAVDYTMFAGITGQILINSTLKGFEHEEFKFSRAAGVYNTGLVDGERIPGVSLPVTKDLSDKEDLLLVKPQKAFPYLTMGENYKILPPTEMRGGIMGVDRLSIYADRTGLVAQNAAKGARVLGISKEQRGLRLLIGGLSVPYIEKFLYDSSPVTLDPYQYESGTGTGQLADTSYFPTRPFKFANDIPANPLNDWHAFETADQYQSKLVDPNDGLPITFGSRPSIFACYTERFNIAVILKAFQTWRISQAVGGFGDGNLNTVGPNPIIETLGDIDVQVSRMLRQEMIKSTLYSEAGVSTPQSDKVWFYGDLKEAIKYMTNWNIKVVMAPANSEAEFTQDIVLRWRFDERGQWFWNEPRLVQRHNFKSPG